MTLDYIEQMAKEYNELLKTVKLPKAHSIKIPETVAAADGKTAENKRQQLSAVEFLLQCSTSKTKTLLLETLREELFRGAKESGSGVTKKFSNADTAYAFLVKKQAEILREKSDFQQDAESYARETRITAVLSLLAN